MEFFLQLEAVVSGYGHQHPAMLITFVDLLISQDTFLGSG